MMKQYILMCDVINSREKNQKSLIEDFRNCTNYINNKFRNKILSPLTITLGDEFQGVIKDLSDSLTIIIELEEFLIKKNYPMKLRYVLYYGNIDTNINTKNAYEMLGDGLTKSRQLINDMKESDSRFMVDINDPVKNAIINNCLNIYENIIDKWKIDKDYILITSLLENRDYKIVAKEINKDRSLVWKREKSLNLSSYYSAKEILNIISKI